MKVQIEDFEKTLLNELEEWKAVTLDDIETTVKKHGEELRDEIKTSKNTPELTGDYKKGWKVKIEGLKTTHCKAIVYNKDQYRLTHLLEYGHATRNGGRSRKFPHLAKAEEKQTKKFVKDFEKLFE